MKYEFLVNPEVYKFFVDDFNEEKYNEILESYCLFKINYDDAPQVKNAEDFFEMFEGNSDANQMLFSGKNKNSDEWEVVAYYYIGEKYEDEEWYKEGRDVFEKIIEKFKIN